MAMIGQQWSIFDQIGHYWPRVTKYSGISLLDEELPAGEGHHPAKKRLLLCSDLSDQVSASVIEINNLNDQVIRLEICQKIYTTKFSGERILHTGNA